jgi:hypothetical protein
MAKKNKTFELTPELKAAITQVYNDGSQNWDRGAGWPPEDEDGGHEIADQYEMVKKFTIYAKDR